jgi:hypothetical protein
MMNLFALLLGAIWRVFRARRELLLENLALRQQFAALKRKHPGPRLTIFDKAFWILAHVFWSGGWKQVLIVITPETVVRWHRAGFRWYWSVIFEKLLCKRVGGHCIWPTGVEPQKSNSLDQLLLFDAILHGFPR